MVDAAYKYADEIWKEKTGESIEQTANRLYDQYGDGMLESAEAQEKVNAELMKGIKGIVNSTKEAYQDAYDQSDIVNPLTPPPFPQTTSTLNEELYNKDKVIYDAYDDAKKNVLAQMAYDSALKEAAKYAPDTDKMRDVMYDIICNKKDSFSAGILSLINEKEGVFLDSQNDMTKGLRDPLVIDMAGDGFDTVSKEESSAYFNLDSANGTAEKTA